jgi:hypothetical protein
MDRKLKPRFEETIHKHIDIIIGLDFSSVPRLHQSKVWPEGNIFVLRPIAAFGHLKIKGLFSVKY